ncbi:extracellular solute-binding protein [Microbacterium sp. SS28]|uniref:extracellular solute-binding protein n=1 Tax=Microbacterium sp. SS28 TaxID=2919948 RepID=UPI001FA9D643|nr:extracellular solute-binding protein [Microbacterium sp. SS28]
MTYSGLTWDHPRGRAALEAAAAQARGSGLDIAWDVHSLEGFESAPIGELAERYDLIVLDHPHLGDALAEDCLQPMDEVMGAAFLEDVARRAVGPSLSTYELGGRTWALPLDAATQVAARRADLVADDPVGWDDVLDLARRAPVALSLSGPHAYLTFASVCASLGDSLALGGAEQIVAPEVGEQALGILAELAASAPEGTDAQNPIALLERMVATDDIGCIPLVYGYVGYADAARPRPVTFGPSPTGPGGVGSTIGGTGIALTRRARVSPALREHLAWLLSDEAQVSFIPAHEGQPSVRAAWESDDVNAPFRDFYRRTRSTIDGAWTRPRFAGFTKAQTELSRVVREGVRERRAPAAVLAQLTDIQRAAVQTAAEGIAS